MPIRRLLNLRFLGWALLGVLAVRVVWLATTLETGFDTLAQDLHVVSFGRVGPDPQRLLQMAPDERAEFWNGLIQHDVQQAEPQSVDRLLEGAWLLELLRLWTQVNNPTETTDLVEARQDLMARAEENSPDDLRVWRSQAQMLFSDFDEFIVGSPLATLREAIAHDSENALYDYLAAVHLDDPEWMEGQGWADFDRRRDEAELGTNGDWFRQRMSRVATLPFVRDVGDVELFARRSLSRLPISPTERRLIAAELFPRPTAPNLLNHLINCLEGPLPNPAPSRENCWDIFRRTLTWDELSRQFGTGDPPSPHLDQKLRSLEASWLARSAEEADEREREILEDQTAVSILEVEITDVALTNLRESCGFAIYDPHWITQLTRTRLLSIAGVVWLSGALVGALFRRVIPPSDYSSVASSCTVWIRALVGLTLGILIAFCLSVAIFSFLHPDTQAVLADVITWLPAVGFALIVFWSASRFLRRTSHGRLRRAIQFGSIVLIAGWCWIYGFLATTAGSAVHENIGQAGRQLLADWLFDPEFETVTEMLAFPGQTEVSFETLLRLTISLAIPLGFAVAAGLTLIAGLLGTCTATGNSLVDWILRRPWQRVLDSQSAVTATRYQSIAQTGQSLRVLGVWGLALWLLILGASLTRAELQYQRAFGEGATPEGYWQLYEDAIADVWSDEELIEILREPRQDRGGGLF